MSTDAQPPLSQDPEPVPARVRPEPPPAEILERLQKGRVIPFVRGAPELLDGASGVGKRSLLRAGVGTERRRRARAAADEGERPAVHVVSVNAWQGDPLARCTGGV
jgi:hypothetical protein